MSKIKPQRQKQLREREKEEKIIMIIKTCVEQFILRENPQEMPCNNKAK